jgi:hypothetical protein
MTLLTPEIRQQLPRLYATEKTPLLEKVAVVKFFDPCSGWTWYAVEGQEDDGEFLFWGLVRGHEDEWGYFSLAELAGVRNRRGLPIERDLYFRPRPIGAVIERD